MNEKLFRKASIEKITGPEQLDDYIRVDSPSLWAVLAAAVILLIAVLIWSTTGTLPTTVSVVGVAKDGVITCYLPTDKAAEIKAGMTAKAGIAEGEVSSVAQTPLSKAEATSVLGSDYLIETMGLTDWNVPVTVTAPGVSDGMVQVSVTVDTVKPISFILN